MADNKMNPWVLYTALVVLLIITVWRHAETIGGLGVSSLTLGGFLIEGAIITVLFLLVLFGFFPKNLENIDITLDMNFRTIVFGVVLFLFFYLLHYIFTGEWVALY
jgi:hypothetical protein